MPRGAAVFNEQFALLEALPERGFQLPTDAPQTLARRRRAGSLADFAPDTLVHVNGDVRAHGAEEFFTEGNEGTGPDGGRYPSAGFVSFVCFCKISVFMALNSDNKPPRRPAR
jgi:hypothetical protein